MDLHGEMGVNGMTKSLFLSDDIHPNAVGSKRMAEIVIGRFKDIYPI